LRKLNLTQQKHASTNQKNVKQHKINTKTKARFTNVKQHKINTKKLKPGLVTFYDILPGNRTGLFSQEKISDGRRRSVSKK